MPSSRRLADVQHVENRLLAEEHEALDALLVFGGHLHFAQRLVGFHLRLGALQQLEFFFEFRRLHLLEIFFQTLQPLFDLPQIADQQIEFHVLDVAQRINLAHMRNRRIVKHAHHMRQCVDVAQMRGVGAVFQRFLPDRAHVDVFHRRMRQLLRVVERGQPVEPVVRNFGDADVRLARVGACLIRKMRLGKNPKQRCLAYLRQANNAGFHKEASSFELLAFTNATQARSGERALRASATVGQHFRINDGAEIAQRDAGRLRLRSQKLEARSCCSQIHHHQPQQQHRAFHARGPNMQRIELNALRIVDRRGADVAERLPAKRPCAE